MENEHDVVRARAYEISQGPQAGTPEEDWLRAERELTVAHEYDTLDRDLEHLGMTLLRLPGEAGAVWRLSLPRGERLEAWEPGNNGLAPPGDIARLIGAVIGGKQLAPAPPLSEDPGAIRLREMIETQRKQLLAHDPGTRLGNDPENLHQHRVAARRTRAFLRSVRAYVDPTWRRSLGDLLRELGRFTGPVRDLDVLIEHVRGEVRGLDEVDREAGEALLARLERERETARSMLEAALDGAQYRSLLVRLRLPPRLSPGTEAVPLERITRKELRRLGKSVDRLGKHPDAEALHRLRIALKRARYAAELAAPSGQARRRFLEDAKALQDVLGEFQDAVVAEQRLREAAVIDLPTAAAFVAGRIAEQQRARRARELERLPSASKRLRKSARLD